ncbi:MAG TPA: MBG domain-containing protein, partial [Humisphaera sp.]
VTVRASDPRVRVVNHTGVRRSVAAGQSASFDVEFVGDGAPHRFDLQFVRDGSDVVLGSIPVVLGTPVAGDCYDFRELEDGEVEAGVDFGATTAVVPPAPLAPTIALAGATVAYDAAPHALAAAATGAGGTAVTGTFAYTYNGSSAAPTAAGTYAVVATFHSGDPAYADAAGTATLTIAPATPALHVAGGTWTFDGAGHAATATATGVGGAPVDGAFAFTYDGSATPPSAPGTYDVSATFTPADANYGGAVGTATLTITRAAAAVAVAAAAVTFDGSPHALAAVATGVDGRPVAGTFAYAYNGSPDAPTAAGTYDVVATFHSGDPAYADAAGHATLTIAPAGPAVVAAGGTFTFDGLPHAATATATGVDGLPVPGVFRFTYGGSPAAPTDAGAYAVVAKFESADPNYAGGGGTATVTIDPAAAGVLVAGGVVIYDGAAHQAVATATGVGGVAVPGAFVVLYDGSPAAPTGAGTYAVTARFTSGDPNYRGGTAAGTLTIGPATPAFSG